MQMRVDKLLSQLQIATRSESKKLFQSGRVRINDIIIKNGAFKCDPDTDQIFVDEKHIVYQEFQYFMLYKPAGCVTSTEDARDKTVMDYLPAEHHRNLSPVGRLDKDTEGLLLITDDGALNHNLLSPGKHVEKTYLAVIDGRVTPDTVKQFADGLDIGEKKLTMPARLEIISTEERSEVMVTITEGRFHQIKRMFQAVGLEVLYLKRLRMGTLCLDESLKPGQCRELKAEEIRNLKSVTKQNEGNFR